MTEYEDSSIIKWYNNLEKRFLQFLEDIPITPKNMKVVSPKLVSISMEACGTLDSIFRHFSPDPAIIDGIRKRRNELTIIDYAKLYSSTLGLSTLKTLVLVSPPFYLIPFSAWVEDSYSSPIWWKKYNKLKHDRIKNINESTLSMTLEALCGLHQVISRLPQLARAMLRQEWLETWNYNPAYVVKLIETGNKEGKTFLAVTNLFATPIGPRSFPDDIADIKPIEYGGSRRLTRFIGRI